MNGGGWEVLDWWIFASSFVATMIVGWAIAELVHRSGRKLIATHKAGEDWSAERRGTWTQVGALEFRKYGRAVGGARWELEAVIFEDTPGGRLAASDFRKAHNVQGPTVLHTRDQCRR